MNLKQGFIRGLISIVVLWTAFWSYSWNDARKDAKDWQQTIVAEAKEKASDPTTGDPNSPRYSIQDAKFLEKQLKEDVAARDAREAAADHAIYMLWTGWISIFFAAVAIAWTFNGLRKPKI